ncbi:RNase adapter RapZ [Streptomyces sp. NPDC095613]|uniref:RapZ C-terminal domain-containing protein n=1 Tax=Streptomyces sp. NPDC095613 TaxID=3155540 RepID=UPI00332A7E6B
MPTVEIVSFGYLHDQPPAEAHLVLDLRHHFRDPHFDLSLRHLTAVDRPIRKAVLGTAGIRALLRATARQARAYLAGPSGGQPLVIAFGCAGGRHRSAVAANQLARQLRRRGVTVTVHHRDINKPVVTR